MKLQRRYSFLFIPEGDGRTRELTLSSTLLVGAATVALVLLVATGLYVMDWVAGVAWRPGGSPLVHENMALKREIDGFETRVASLQHELDEVFAYQQMVAAAVDVTPLDAETRAAGIGGRGPLQTRDELAVLRVAPDLDSLLRQSRVQRAGMAALLDTLARREDFRNHMPSIRPCDTGWLSSRFGKRRDPFTGRQTYHRGLDFSVPVGTQVRATADGVAVKVERQRGLGRVVKIEHADGIMTVYAHLSETLVEKGERVERGQIIALSGNSGRSTAPHLHYEVRLAGHPVNPLTYILDTHVAQR